MYKSVGNRYIEKRVNVRVEHVIPSKCNQDFLARAHLSTKLGGEAKQAGTKAVSVKRQPAMPRPGHFVSSKNNEPVLIAPIPYEILI